MWTSKFLVPIWVSLVVTTVFGLRPCKQDHLDAGLAILSSNDLSNSPACDPGAILITEPVDFSSAVTACQGIHEDLIPLASILSANIKSSLRYQFYQGYYPEDQQFWISRSPCGSCQSLEAGGRVSVRDCNDLLPAICTQSAPLSNGTFEDTAPRFQISRPLGLGQITGYRDFHAWKFLGVRFAAQPERFDYSTVYRNPADNITALAYAGNCFQDGTVVSRGSMTEDCLFLNIWTPYLPPLTPDADSSKLKPVLFWIHGGAYQTGTAADPGTDGTNMASRGDVVVVTINYRLGNLGFLPFDDGTHNGNYAIGDMVTALEWVAENIAIFGGDAKNVTIMGQSAGGSAVHSLLTTPKARGLFQKAIPMSDTYGWNYDFLNYDRYNSVMAVYNSSTKVVLHETSCLNATNQIECLREIDPYQLTNNLTIKYAFPVQDGSWFTSYEYNFTDPNALSSDIPVLHGVTRDEDGILAPIPPKNMTVKLWVESAFALAWLGVPVDLTSVFISSGLTLPANASADDIFNATVRVMTDGIFTCLTQAVGYSAARHGSLAKVYNYSFNRTYSPPTATNQYCDAPKTEDRPYGDPDKNYYRCHAGEVWVVFGVLARNGLPDRDGFDMPFSRVVLDYWTSFIRTADPNPDKEYLTARGYLETLEQTDRNAWTQVDALNPQVRELQWNGSMVPFVDIDMCSRLGVPVDGLENNPSL